MPKRKSPQEGFTYIFMFPGTNNERCLKTYFFCEQDKYNNYIFLNLETASLEIFTPKKFSYLHRFNLYNEVKSIDSLKQMHLTEYLRLKSEEPNIISELDKKSKTSRLLTLYNELNDFQKDKLVKYAETKCSNEILNDDEKTLLECFDKLNLFERESIIVQVKALAKRYDSETIKK